MPIYYLRRDGSLHTTMGDSAPVTVQEITIPHGNEGIGVSASKLIAFIKKFRKEQKVIRPLALKLTRGCRSKDYACNVKSIYEWVKRNVKWERDPHNVEMIQDPLLTLQRGAGDCDDHTVLIGSLLQSIGIPTRIVLISSMRDAQGIYNHVYTEVLIPWDGRTQWVSIDSTPLNSEGKYFPMGSTPPGYAYKRMEVN